jgi:hypothetical protein
MLTSTTPTYRGPGQTAAASSDGGILGALTALLGGGSTPAYAGTGQPAPSASGGLLGSGTPAYQPAPVAKPSPAPTPTPAPTQDGEAPCEITIGDMDPFGSGPIAIVIPRPRT